MGRGRQSEAGTDHRPLVLIGTPKGGPQRQGHHGPLVWREVPYRLCVRERRLSVSVRGAQVLTRPPLSVQGGSRLRGGTAVYGTAGCTLLVLADTQLQQRREAQMGPPPDGAASHPGEGSIACAARLAPV
ncbi:hypothetical protein Saso_60790 [Streptomyces asoensis]|uniref:Uncharacterized protein n=1 Tax=Streptomyces asoensis TaxID=249586 RepID=A0ABQ3S8J3_9ACTN|nr:hypothetical protein GCM10010496_54080 [Streptomyces asoensis]GHI64429.1 hypothetical protein Saso_60790 [Streptomyces asoensis]